MHESPRKKHRKSHSIPLWHRAFNLLMKKTHQRTPKHRGIRWRANRSDFCFVSPFSVSFCSRQHLINEKRVHKCFGTECKTQSTLIALAKLDGMHSAKTETNNRSASFTQMNPARLRSQFILRPFVFHILSVFFVLDAFTASATIVLRTYVKKTNTQIGRWTTEPTAVETICRWICEIFSIRFSDRKDCKNFKFWDVRSDRLAIERNKSLKCVYFLRRRRLISSVGRYLRALRLLWNARLTVLCLRSLNRHQPATINSNETFHDFQILVFYFFA